MADRRKIRFLMVDDHALLREGIAALLAGEQDMAVVGSAAKSWSSSGRYGPTSR